MTAGVFIVPTGVMGTSSTTLFTNLSWDGTLFCPLWSYFYANRAARGWAGIILRSSIFILAIVLSPTTDFNDGILPNPDMDNIGIWTLAGLIIIIYDIYDIAKIKHHFQKGRFTVTPQINPTVLDFNLTFKF